MRETKQQFFERLKNEYELPNAKYVVRCIDCEYQQCTGWRISDDYFFDQYKNWKLNNNKNEVDEKITQQNNKYLLSREETEKRKKAKGTPPASREDQSQNEQQ